MSTCKAAKQYNIPKTTLMDRKNNRDQTSKVGRKNDLTEEEERALKGYIDYMASINHPLRLLPGLSPKKVQIQIGLIQRMGQAISGTEISKQGTI